MSSSYVTNNYNGPLIIESTLKKAKNPNSSSRFFSKFNTRYFILDLINGSFFYLKQKNSKQIEKSYNLLDISGFDFNPKDYDKCSWKYVFSIQLQGLVYKLYTDSLGVHKTWTNALMCLLHLNSTQMYNNTLTQPFSAPSTAESHSQVFQSRAFTPEPQSYQQPTSAMSPQSPDWQQEEDDEAAQIEGNYNQWNTHTEPNQVDEQIKYHREVNLNAWTNS